MFGIEGLDLILKERRLCWYGHMERSNGAVKTAVDIQIVGTRGPGRPKMTWKQLTDRDCREWKLSAINPHEPGHLAQSVGHLTRKSGVLGLIPSLATYFRFSFCFFKKGSCQLMAKVCARSTG